MDNLLTNFYFLHFQRFNKHLRLFNHVDNSLKDVHRLLTKPD
ncbi:hypothetical protein [Dyadobacter luticola]|nr:hypothetical protein [Dyadobacter luticola]